MKLKLLCFFQLSPALNNPIIPAQAGIQKALSWIPACAGMVGLGLVCSEALKSQQPLVSVTSFFKNPPAFHDEANSFQRRNIRQRIAVDGDNIRRPADSDRARYF